jgi:hypothetical protein
VFHSKKIPEPANCIFKAASGSRECADSRNSPWYRAVDFPIVIQGQGGMYRLLLKKSFLNWSPRLQKNESRQLLVA